MFKLFKKSDTKERIEALDQKIDSIAGILNNLIKSIDRIKSKQEDLHENLYENLHALIRSNFTNTDGMLTVLKNKMLSIESKINLFTGILPYEAEKLTINVPKIMEELDRELEDLNGLVKEEAEKENGYSWGGEIAESLTKLSNNSALKVPEPASKIEYGIPVPPVKRTYNGRRKSHKYDADFEKMQVGGSFPIDDKNIGAAAKNYAKRNDLDWRFETRSEGDKTRIWRVK